MYFVLLIFNNGEQFNKEYNAFKDTLYIKKRKIILLFHDRYKQDTIAINVTCSL
jgi:hypothetical protein